jgi:hypothetical protein
MTWEFTPELEEEILTALENGEGLNAWCKGDGRPSRSTVIKWQRDNKEFNTKCARAREAAGELSADEQQEIVNRVLSGDITSDVARVVLSAMQWRAEKLAPKKFSNKLQLSGDADNPIETKNHITIEMVAPTINQ